MKIGALYIRVSTDDQTEYSPDAQIRLGLEYAKKNEIVIPKEFIFKDDGISGRKADNRPAFQQMIGTARKSDHPLDVIIVWKFSRFARNQEEAIVYKNLLKKSNVDVVSVSEPIPEGFIGELVQRIFEWMDEYYSINLSGEVKRGMTERAMKGHCNVPPPLGYKLVNGAPEIVPAEAEIVKNIFDWYVNERMSFYDIAVKLNALGYKTKRGGKFQNRTVAYIIRNDFYNGKIVWGKQDFATRTPKPRSEWIITDGEQKLFISKELFERAQEIDRTTTRPYKARPASTYKHWLSGILVCASCGNKLVKNQVNKNGSVAFCCTGYGHGACRNQNRITDEKLLPIILDAMNDVLNGSDVEYKIVTNNKTAADPQTDIIKRNLKNLENKEVRIKEAYVDGIDTLAEYKANKERIVAEREYLLSLLPSEKVSCKDDLKHTFMKKIKSAYDIISSSDTDFALKHEAIASVIEKIVVDKAADKIQIFFYVREN